MFPSQCTNNKYEVFIVSDDKKTHSYDAGLVRQSNLQSWTFAIIRLLNKPYENEALRLSKTHVQNAASILKLDTL